MLGYVSFPWLISNRRGQGEKKKARPKMEEGTKERFARREKEKTRKKLKTEFFFFFYHFLYMLVPENTDIYGKWFFT